MRAFLEKNEKEWLDDFVYASREPLIDLGFDIIPFDGNRLDYYFDTTFSYNIKNDILIGSVGATTRFFKACGIEVPKYLGYPQELLPFLGRNVSIVKYSEIDQEYPYFIKPVNDVKLFTGTIVDNPAQFRLLKFFCSEITDDTELFLFDVIDIKSEFRCFIYNNEIKGIQYYKGDCTLFPNVGDIKEMIASYKNSPVAYTLDVGVIKKIDDNNVIYDETILVEINDFWAIGSYGFDGKTYVKMAIDRMREIAGLPTRIQLNSSKY